MANPTLSLSDYYRRNAAGIGGECVNSDIIIVQKHASLIDNSNIVLSDSALMYEHMLGNLTALLPYVNDTNRGEQLLVELSTDPESVHPFNMINYVLGEWEQIGKLSYTYRLLFDISSIWSDITFDIPLSQPTAANT